MKVILNPDKDIVSLVRKGIKESDGHCPCILPEARNGDTKCPCKVFRETKDCHCMLYIKTD